MTHKPDAVEPDRVISDRHCVNCGHLYYDHLVAMNTIQTGECKHCRCYHPETASREQLWREVEQLTAELDALRREVEAGKEKQADFVRITLDAVTEFFSHPGIKELRESLDASATEKLLALEEAFAALEGESR